MEEVLYGIADYADLVMRQETVDADTVQNILAGTVVKYGDVAVVPIDGVVMREKFMPGAFTWHKDIKALDIGANIQHERSRGIARTGYGMTLEDNTTQLRANIVLGDDTDGLDAAKKAKNGILRGLSPEYLRVPGGSRLENGVLVRHKAQLIGIGVVDSPSYKQSLLEKRAEEYLSYCEPERKHFRIW